MLLNLLGGAGSVIFVFSFYLLYHASHPTNLCKTDNCVRSSDRMMKSMDFQTNPCDDFYQFTCGNWIENHYASVDSLKMDDVYYSVWKILKSNKTAHEPIAIEQARQIYQACMNTIQIKEIGLQPIIDYLRMVHLPELPLLLMTTNQNTSQEFDWIRSIAKIKRTIGIDIIFGFHIIPLNRSKTRVILSEPKMNLFSPHDELASVNHFHDNNANTGNSITKIKGDIDNITNVIRAFVLISYPNISMEAIVPKITMLAKTIIGMKEHFTTLVDAANNFADSDINRKVEYENLSIKEFQNFTDHLIAPKSLPIWEKYFGILFENTNATIEVSLDRTDIYYEQHILSYISNLPNEILELYVWWSVVEQLVPYTNQNSSKSHCISIVNQWMGMALSYALADTDFVQTTKPKILSMIENIRRSFHNLVDEIDWMDDQSKSSTHEKLNAMQNYVGFPEWILKTVKLNRYYASITLNKSTHVQNVINMQQWKMMKMLENLHNPEDMVWLINAPIHVNAFYRYDVNAMALSLPMLQYPFYDLGLESLNYGAIGASIGHEIIHGFDSNGQHYDKDGNRRQWWTNQTIMAFNNRAECFVKQYSSYIIENLNENVNGELTLSENIADNSGLRAAFYAYQLYVKGNGNEKLLPGFEQYTPQQLFFISFGMRWCETHNDESIERKLKGVHAPNRERVQGVMENSDEFKKAFNCHSKSELQSEKHQCRIW